MIHARHKEKGWLGYATVLEPRQAPVFGADLNRARLFLTAAIVLVAGLLSAATIYLVADDEPTATAYVIVGDVAYPVDPTRTRPLCCSTGSTAGSPGSGRARR